MGTAKYITGLAVAAVLFHWKTLLTCQFTLLVGPEAVDYTYSWLRFWIQSLREGRVPLWDAYAFCGRPFHAEMLPSGFYPLHLPLLLVPFDANGLLSQWVYHGLFAFTQFLGAVFAFALLRELRLSRFASFVGALSFSMCTILADMGWLPFQEACAWLPAIFLFFLRAVRAEQPRRAVLQASLSGLCLGMSVLTGGIHFTILQGIALVTAAIFYATSERAAAARVGLILAVVLVVGGGIGAVQLLPSWEYGKLSLRFIDGGAFPSDEKIPYHRLHPGLWPQSIVTALFPYGFDGRFGGGEAWAAYAGVLPFFFAVIAVWKRWECVWVRYLTALAAASFAYSLGEFSPLHGWLYATVPMMWVVRSASRFVYLSSFALAVLAAFGVDAAFKRAGLAAEWRPAAGVLRWTAIVCLAALFLPAVFTAVKVNIWTYLSLLLILAACGTLAYMARHEAGRGFRLVMAAFIFFDLSAFHFQARDKSEAGKPTAHLDKLISLKNAAAFVKAQPGLGRVHVEVPPAPNIGDAYGVQAFWGGGGTMLRTYARMWPQYLNLLNVRYLVRPAAATEPGPLYQDANWKVYENPNAYPRAWIAHRAVVEASQDAAFARMNDANIDLHHVAVMEEAPARPLQDSGAPDAVRFRSYRNDGMEADVTAASAGMLVFSEMFYPGWRATVNGRPARIYRVDGGLRGVLVPAGASRVALEYAPLSIYAGALVSALTLLVVAAGFAFEARRRLRVHLSGQSGTE